MRTTDAPLGPTCVYALAGSRRDITLTVEKLSFSQVTRHMHKRKRTTVSGHRAVCGSLGGQMLLVALPGGHLLNVTAPCPTARRFAALALSRLGA
jgi:hypothetical protein